MAITNARKSGINYPFKSKILFISNSLLVSFLIFGLEKI